MADKLDFDETFSDWNVLAGKWENEQPIYKYEVDELLRKGVIPTQKAMPFLTAVFNKEYKFKKAKGIVNRSENVFIRINIALNVLVREIELQDSPKNLLGAFTSREQAKEDVAEKYGISVRDVENYLLEHKEHLIKTLDKI